MSDSKTMLPAIVLSASDLARLQRLATAAAGQFPRTADFLAREIDRARVVDPVDAPPSLVTMGSEVEFRDDTTGKVRRVTLVYPDEADIDSSKISVLNADRGRFDRSVIGPVDRVSGADRRCAIVNGAGRHQASRISGARPPVAKPARA